MRSQPGSSSRDLVGLVRFMGYSRRCGSYSSCKLARPFEQMGVLGQPSLRASTRTILPSLTVALMPHLGTWLHMSQ